MNSKFFHRGILALFFLSGYCGLVYQVVWLRLAMSHFGVITPVLSVVVSVFMAGLSLGSWGAGRWIQAGLASRHSSAIYYYAATEAGIGLSAFCVPFLFTAGAKLLRFNSALNSFPYLMLSAMVIAVCLWPWCCLMGATFPLMAAFIREKDPSEWSSFSSLYSANVLGALAGTVLSAGILIELFGFHKTLVFTGGVNFFVAAGALLLSALSLRVSPASADSVIREALPTEVPENRRFIRVVLFITGFVSLASEVVWIRAYTSVLMTTVYAFAYILGIYLLTTWLGSCFYRWHVRKGGSLSTEKLLAMLSVSSFLPILIPDPRFNLGWAGIGLAISPFCALLGYLTPKLIDAYSHGAPSPMGGAYALNVLGCITGPLVVSYGVLPFLGVKGALLLLAMPILVIWLPTTKRLKRSWAFATVACVVVSAACGVFYSSTYEEQLHPGLVQRDYTATVIACGHGWKRRLVVNGVGMTYLTPTTKAMAHLPLIFLPREPRSALVICFGMGTTFRSLLSYGIDSTVVELVPSVVKVFGYYFADAEQCLENPHAHVVIDDGRRFLERTQQKFDLITLDPPPPVEAAASSLLYSKEFYTTVRARLAPGGILAQWLPGKVEDRILFAVIRSLEESFPHVRVFKSARMADGFHLIASEAPLEPVPFQVWIQRLPEAARRDLVEWDPKLGIKTLYSFLMAKELDPLGLIASDPGMWISDDRPMNEYYLLRRWLARRKDTFHVVF